MPEERLGMKRLKEVLRLKLTANLSNRQIGKAVNISPGTVSYYTRAALASGLSWDEISALDDTALVARLETYCQQLKGSQCRQKIAPDYAGLYQELKHKGVTLQLLHEEYVGCHGSTATYSYSAFCCGYRQYIKQQRPSMRQNHQGGEKVFVDYAGPGIGISDSKTGAIHEAKLFVGVMGASHYVFAEATLSRQIPDWIGSHVRMLEFFGGVPRMIIPDNEKAGVKNACYYDPELNPNYAAFAAHYDTIILPTRPYKPKDKAKVENAVLLVERWILAKLRHQKFFTLRALNDAIRVLLDDLNHRPFKKMSGTRRSWFEMYDLPHLKPLCDIRYEVADFKWVQVRLDYHIECENHYYSVPHTLVGQKIEYRATRSLVECYHQGKRIACHPRSDVIGGTSTQEIHIPQSHRLQHQWTPQVFLNWATTMDTSVVRIAEHIIANQPHPECCYRIYLGLRNLMKQFGHTEFIQACRYGVGHLSEPSYRSLKSILKTKIYRQPRNTHGNTRNTVASPIHKNLRGAAYYAKSNSTTEETIL